MNIESRAPVKSATSVARKPADAQKQLESFIEILLGSGNQTRFIRLESADVLARPEVEALVAAAVSHAKTPLPASGRGKLIIRSVSTKQRPCRKSSK